MQYTVHVCLEFEVFHHSRLASHKEEERSEKGARQESEGGTTGACQAHISSPNERAGPQEGGRRYLAKHAVNDFTSRAEFWQAAYLSSFVEHDDRGQLLGLSWAHIDIKLLCKLGVPLQIHLNHRVQQPDSSK